MKDHTKHGYDVIIVGAGAAGCATRMSLGVGCSKPDHRARAPGGELLNTDLIEDYIGFREHQRGGSWRKRWPSTRRSSARRSSPIRWRRFADRGRFVSRSPRRGQDLSRAGRDPHSRRHSHQARRAWREGVRGEGRVVLRGCATERSSRARCWRWWGVETRGRGGDYLTRYASRSTSCTGATTCLFQIIAILDRERALLKDLGCAQLVAPVHDVDLRGVAREVVGLLDRGVSTPTTASTSP